MKGNAKCHTFSSDGVKRYEDMRWESNSSDACPFTVFIKYARCKINKLGRCTGKPCSLLDQKMAQCAEEGTH